MMRKRSLSIKNKILVVLATIPIFSIGLVVVMAANTFKDDKVTYVFNSVLSGAQAKSSSASSQINSFIQSLKAMTVNYDPVRNSLTPNGRKYFETENSLKGFYNFRWTGQEFNMAFDKSKDIQISDAEMAFLTPILQESWHNSVAIAPSKDFPMHLYLVAKLNDGEDIAAVLIESTDFFSLFDKAAQGESFLYHSSRGLMIGARDIPELKQYLEAEIFPKKLGQQTKETMIGEDPFLMSLSKVSIGSLYVVSIVDKRSALAAVEKLLPIVLTTMVNSLSAKIASRLAGSIASPTTMGTPSFWSSAVLDVARARAVTSVPFACSSLTTSRPVLRGAPITNTLSARPGVTIRASMKDSR